jgi:hypothetical protein
MDTKPPPLSHLDEYKALHDEITLYQHEIHRTWLWAIITAGAIYAWLASHSTVINGFPKIFVGLLPVFFIFVCAARYFSFRLRIRSITDYLLELEKDAFGQENNPKSIPQLAGFVNFSKEWEPDFVPKIKKFFPYFPKNKKLDGPFFNRLSCYVTIFLWFALIICSFWLSWSLSKTDLNERAAFGHDFGHHNACSH